MPGQKMWTFTCRFTSFLNFGKLSFLLLLLCLPVQGHSENLINIFELAINNDPQLKAALANRDALKEVKNQNLSVFLPSISITGQAVQHIEQWNTYIFRSENEDIETDLGTNKYLSYQSYLTLKQTLFDLRAYRDIKASNLQITKAEIEYRLAQQELLFRIVESYFNVLSKQDALNFARAEKNAIAKQLQQTRDRFEAGLIAVTDLHEAQARHDLAVAHEIISETKLANSQEEMREITNEIPKGLFGLKRNSPLVPPTPTNINDWVNAARVQNLSIAAAQLEADVTSKHIDTLRAERYPVIDITANYGQVFQGGLFTQIYQDSNISLNTRMDIFQGNRISSKVRQTKLQLEAANQVTDQVERKVVTETRNAYLGVLAGLSYVKAISQALSSSDSALKATEAGFDVGTRSAIEVLDAQRELFRNQRDYAQARYDYILNTLRLKVAVGLLTIDDLEQINGWLE